MQALLKLRSMCEVYIIHMFMCTCMFKYSRSNHVFLMLECQVSGNIQHPYNRLCLHLDIFPPESLPRPMSRSIHIFIYIYIYTHTVCMYIYIYINLHREEHNMVMCDCSVISSSGVIYTKHPCMIHCSVWMLYTDFFLDYQGPD